MLVEMKDVALTVLEVGVIGGCVADPMELLDVGGA